MKEYQKNTNTNKNVDTVEAEISHYTEHYCRNCRYFDSNYHGGYCDYHKQNVHAEDSGCRQWWWNGK